MYSEGLTIGAVAVLCFLLGLGLHRYVLTNARTESLLQERQKLLRTVDKLASQRDRAEAQIAEMRHTITRRLWKGNRKA